MILSSTNNHETILYTSQQYTAIKFVNEQHLQNKVKGNSWSQNSCLPLNTEHKLRE